ncbi:NAD-dependent epimerase/dehydratase family protein [Chiayiivirga flava]|uniref:Nucleoside-diphosphate-sugar epimerase n=1 Tax=Chiayiivirga flava TaxID=659595 RepID=A0A7W8D894_9GAMM|nr:NAD-dependent epimerase/dehydratase family protein [Chiayiivirga flava]MBB5208441.1 nucleoside-diphosphate-sugar epimerase [Chiayiivirga flava]
MRITVIGGSGFIGTRLVRALRDAGHEVRIFDKAPSLAHPELLRHGDVRDAAAVAAALAHCDCAIDLAAEHRDDVRPCSLYAQVNVGGARNIAAAAALHGVPRIVFASSAAVYGPGRSRPDESAPPRPASDYGRSKADAEAVYAAWAAQDSARSLLVLRPAVVFGEGNRGNVFTLIDHLRRRRFVLPGRGDNRKSMGYVGNLVAFVAGRLDLAAGVHTVNYADPPDLRTADMVEAIRLQLSLPPPPRVPLPVALAGAALLDAIAGVRGRPSALSRARVRRFCAETTLATEALQRLGFRAPVPFDEALARTIASLLPDAR